MAVQSVDRARDILHPGMRRLGFGCGDLFSGATHEASVRLIETALDVGISYFDVAPLYGNGSAEAVLGSVLPRVRDRVIITSKAGILPWSMRLWPRIAAKTAKTVRSLGPLARAVVPPPIAAARYGAFSLSEIGRSLERSLKTLRTDYLDIFLLHECGVVDSHKAEILDFLKRLRTDGKIRTFGIATHYDETIKIINEIPEAMPVAQFASDALNRNITYVPLGKVELIVTHSAIKLVLPRIINHFMAAPDAGIRWTECTGIAANDRTGIARVLLAHAVKANENGVVLFSSSQQLHIADVVSASSCDSGLLDALDDTLWQLRSGSTA